MSTPQSTDQVGPLGMGPLMWRKVNLDMWNSVNASKDEPVSREEAQTVYDSTVNGVRYRYLYPAAWTYYRWLDEFNAHLAALRESQP